MQVFCAKQCLDVYAGAGVADVPKPSMGSFTAAACVRDAEVLMRGRQREGAEVRWGEGLLPFPDGRECLMG